ncbi:FadR/GntR family transcriptional regulator [Roseovarius sp.]|uniref:FadR/GntR family transcriptional regulator n=1 Tax=Roseovarius sp. TaxID=1486281 RepID=UPI003A986216
MDNKLNGFSVDHSQEMPIFRQIAEELRRRILDGQLQAGDRLPPETAIAENLGIHRSSVREAIRALEQSGFVRRDPGKRKLHVALPETKEFSRRLVDPLILSKVTFEEVWETIRALDPMAAAAAAKRRRPDHIKALEENAAKTRAAWGDVELLTLLDIEFHEIVAAAADNRVLQSIRIPISDLFYPSFFTVMSRVDASDRLLVAHEKIIDAIRRQDEETAHSWMVKHINDFRKGYELARLDMSGPARPMRNTAS